MGPGMRLFFIIHIYIGNTVCVVLYRQAGPRSVSVHVLLPPPPPPPMVHSTRSCVGHTQARQSTDRGREVPPNYLRLCDPHPPPLSTLHTTSVLLYWRRNRFFFCFLFFFMCVCLRAHARLSRGVHCCRSRGHRLLSTVIPVHLAGV